MNFGLEVYLEEEGGGEQEIAGWRRLDYISDIIGWHGRACPSKQGMTRD